VADSIDQAFEEAFTELGLDDTPEDGPVEEPEPEPEAEAEEPAEDPAGDEAAEDEEGAEEGEEGGEDDPDEEGESGPVIEITEGATIRLPDGTEVPAEKAVLFQQAWTKKTTELAEQRKEFEQERDTFADVEKQVNDTYEQMRSWYEDRVTDPSSWVQEIALESGDATRTVAKALFELGRAGKLDQKFMETFGIEEGVVADMAGTAAKDDEVAALRQRLDAQEQDKARADTVQQKAAEYQKQWDDIKLSHDLELSGPAETDVKRELMEFAVQKNLTGNLEDAYLLMQAVNQAQQPSGPAPTPAPAVSEQKRALSAVNPRSTGSGAARSAQKSTPKDSRSAALEAIAEFGL